jgi:hypothetical protein
MRIDPLNVDQRSAFYVGLVEGQYGRLPSAEAAVTALPALRASAPSGLRRVASHGATALLERCDYCGCSRHACGCDERFEYEDIRDNPQLIAR